LQAAYETFGCNEGNVFFMGIDKGNTDPDVIAFDLTYGIEYPSVSGQDGGGNEVHLQYNIQATPTIVVIMPDRSIAFQQIFPPSTDNVVNDVTSAGGIQQSCTTSTNELFAEDIITIGPNPVVENAYIYLDIQDPAILEITVHNLTGQEVLRTDPKRFVSGDHVVPINLSSNPDGFYFVQLKHSGNVIATRKLILSK
jgi:hypothetical protein